MVMKSVEVHHLSRIPAVILFANCCLKFNLEGNIRDYNVL